jgi:SAM-dependent methyltransferase
MAEPDRQIVEPDRSSPELNLSPNSPDEDGGCFGKLVRNLLCPQCSGSLAVDGSSASCPAGHRFDFHDGYLDLSVQNADAITLRTFESFGFEWNTFDDVRGEDEKFWKRISTGLPMGELVRRVGLDAGCGKGRYTRFLAPYLEYLVALDGSPAVAAAARNLAELPNVMVVKSDLRTAPFANSTFGFVSSIVVLHHLEDPKAGFFKLLSLLAPGGIMFLYLYSAATTRGLRKAGLAVARCLRRATIRMPHRLLRILCIPIAGVLKILFVVPGEIGEKAKVPQLAALPLSTYRGKSFRSLWLDTFDRLSAPVEHRFSWPELEGWFNQAGMQVVSVIEDAGWYVVARKDPMSESQD